MAFLSLVESAKTYDFRVDVWRKRKRWEFDATKSSIPAAESIRLICRIKRMGIRGAQRASKNVWRF